LAGASDARQFYLFKLLWGHIGFYGLHGNLISYSPPGTADKPVALRRHSTEGSDRFFYVSLRI